MHHYALVFAVVPFLFAIIAVLANRRGGKKSLWIAWVIGTMVLVTVGVISWRRQGFEELPLIVYIALGALPTLAAIYAIRWAALRSMPIFAQVLIGGTVCWITITPSLLLGVYVLGRILPF